MEPPDSITIAESTPAAPRSERNSSSAPKPMESLFAKMFLISASLLVCIIAIELLARFYLWNVASDEDFRVLASISQIKDRYGEDFYIQDVDNRRLSWSPHHFLGHYPTPNYRHGENAHNSLGYRGEEFSDIKPEGTFRIAAIGGSTTYSIDVQDYRKSYPQLLEQYLHDDGFDFAQVINAGVIAHTSYQNLMNAQFRILPLQPDLIIVYQGFNDIAERFVYPYSRYMGDQSGSVEPLNVDIFMPDIIEYSTALRILGIRAGHTRSHSSIEWHFSRRPRDFPDRHFSRQINNGTYPSGFFEEIPVSAMLENNPPIHFERNLLNLVAVASRHNVQLLLVTMVIDDDFHEITGSRKNLKFSSNEYVQANMEHNDVTRRIAESTGTPIMDLAAHFPDDHTLFTDALHMTEKGNRLRAQLIGDFVIRQFSEDMHSAATSS